MLSLFHLAASCLAAIDRIVCNQECVFCRRPRVDAVVATDRAAGLTFAHQRRSYRHVAAKLQTLLHTIMEFYRRFEHFSDVFLAK